MFGALGLIFCLVRSCEIQVEILLGLCCGGVFAVMYLSFSSIEVQE